MYLGKVVSPDWSKEFVFEGGEGKHGAPNFGAAVPPSGIGSVGKV
jgi:hypothetical protein